MNKTQCTFPCLSELQKHHLYQNVKKHTHTPTHIYKWTMEEKINTNAKNHLLKTINFVDKYCNYMPKRMSTKVKLWLGWWLGNFSFTFSSFRHVITIDRIWGNRLWKSTGRLQAFGDNRDWSSSSGGELSKIMTAYKKTTMRRPTCCRLRVLPMAIASFELS